MALTVSIHQAAQTALRAWLASQFAGVTIWDRWPEAGVKLPAQAISVLQAGGPDESDTDPVIVKSAAVAGSGINRTYTWRVQSVELPLQLDVWTTDQIHRDDIVARMKVALSAGPRATLGDAFLASTGTTTNKDPISRGGILLVLPGAWAHIIANYWFDRPSIDDSPDGTTRNEYRASYDGTATYDVTVDAVSAQMARAILKQNIYGLGITAVPTATKEIMTVSATSTTNTRGP